ncbi:Lactation elevated protein 1, partial [Irineochytrium annulatum]
MTEDAFAGRSLIPILVDGSEPDFIGPRGLWIHGEVGTGKTLVMDLFYNAMPTARKRRVHFHRFMTGVYSKINDFNRISAASTARQAAHVTQLVAREWVKDAWLVCFDEFQVTDVATATLMRQIFAHMFRLGAVVVATSNKAPDDLYTGGFQNNIYLPFIDLIKDRCDVLHIRSKTDYRELMLQEKPQAVDNRMYYKLDTDANKAAFVQVFKFDIYGRTATVPRAVNGMALFTFDELCGSSLNPFGPVDYLELCMRFHTIVLQSVPVMGLLEKNEARRFITFIDAAYENKVKLIMSAEDDPQNLFATEPITPLGPRTTSDSAMHREMLGDLAGEMRAARESTKTPEGSLGNLNRLAILTAEDERFAFRRAVSRVLEMGSSEYNARRHEPLGADWDGLDALRRVKGLEEDELTPPAKQEDEAKSGGEAESRKPEEGVRDAVAVFGADQPRGARMTELSDMESYKDDFGDEAGYRGYVVRMQDRLAKGGRVGETIKERVKDRESRVPRIRETHFWGMVHGKWSLGARTFWSNLSVGKEGHDGKDGVESGKGDPDGEGDKGKDGDRRKNATAMIHASSLRQRFIRVLAICLSVCLVSLYFTQSGDYGGRSDSNYPPIVNFFVLLTGGGRTSSSISSASDAELSQMQALDAADVMARGAMKKTHRGCSLYAYQAFQVVEEGAHSPSRRLAVLNQLLRSNATDLSANSTDTTGDISVTTAFDGGSADEGLPEEEEEESKGEELYATLERVPKTIFFFHIEVYPLRPYHLCAIESALRQNPSHKVVLVTGDPDEAANLLMRAYSSTQGTTLPLDSAELMARSVEIRGLSVEEI